MRYPTGKDNADYLKNWYNAQEYGAKTSYGFHEGNDINLKTRGATDLGQPLYAVADGKIVYYHNNSHPTRNFGKHMVLECDTIRGKRWYHYAHCEEITDSVKEVKEGEVIGKLGNSGTTPPHLHFSVFKVDPKTLPSGIDSIAKTEAQLHQFWEEFELLSISQGNMSENLQEILLTKFGVKTLDELKMVWDKEMKNLKDSRELVEELRIKLKEAENGYSSAQKLLSDEKKSHYQDFELLAEMLGAIKNDDLTLFRKNIEGKIETCITFEDKARDLEKVLEKERKEYEKRIQDLSNTVDAYIETVKNLQNSLNDAKTEIEKLKQEKPESSDPQLKPPTLIGILIDYIKGLFK